MRHPGLQAVLDKISSGLHNMTIVNAKQSFLSRGLPNKRDIRAGTWPRQRYDRIQNNNMDSC